MPIVECVPNFSEGRRPAVIDQIAAAIRAVEGAVLLDVDPGKATNRTVVTFVGEPEAVLEAAFQAIKTASQLIDMRQHTGAHARMGATDVCPFIPVSGITMQECAELARRLGKRVGDELGIPVYLYEHAASRMDHKNLADIRKGEYEGLSEKLRDPNWKPDFGPATLNDKSGATVIGAREFLIAYNVNLNTRDRKLAQDIALDIREAGRAKRDARGEIVRNPDGTSVMVSGKLKAVKAVGWFIEEYSRAQVSINLVDYHVTGVHQAFDAVDEAARKRGLRATGSELVGLIPSQALLDAGKHYLKRQGKSPGVPERQLVETAVQSLGLSELVPFVPEEKIIEYRLARDMAKKLLIRKSVAEFADEVSTESPAPGGGSVAALCAALAAALSSMVANLTVGKQGFEKDWDAMKEMAERAQTEKDACLRAVDEDSQAFERVMDAMRLPATNDSDKSLKAAQVLEANRGATLVPLRLLERTLSILALAQEAASKGNPNSLSDAGTAAAATRAAAEGAYLNVIINLKNIDSDPTWVEETRSRAVDLLGRARMLSQGIIDDLERRLSPTPVS